MDGIFQCTEKFSDTEKFIYYTIEVFYIPFKVVASMSFSCVSQPGALVVHGREEPAHSSDCLTFMSQVTSLMMERDCNGTAAGLVQFLFFFQFNWDNWHIIVYKFGNTLQYSCLQNPMDRGAWKAAVHGVAK